MSQVTWATQFSKQNILRTVSIGYQPYFPFSQQWAMEYTSRGDKGYFDYVPEELSGRPQDSTTQRGDKYPFAERMKAFMGDGEKGLQHMSRYYNPDNRALQSAKAAPRSGVTAAAARGRGLASMFKSTGSTKAIDMPGGRDFGEESLGQFSKAMDKHFAGDISSSRSIERGETKTGKFYGGSFDKNLESESPSMRAFWDAKIGSEKMKSVHSVEMTRAKGGKTMNKVLSMSSSEIDASKEIGIKNKFKAHVNSVFKDYNTRIRDAVIAMMGDGTGDGIGSEAFQQYKEATSDTGAGDIFGVRGLFPILPSDHVDKLLNDNIRQFVGRAGRSAMIQQLNNAGKGPSLHIHQVKLGKNTLGLALVGFKIKTYKKQPYPQITLDKASSIITMPAGTENNLIDAYGAWMKTETNLSQAEITKELTKAETYASDRLVATQDRMSRIYDEATTSADYLATMDVGVAVGTKVESNVRLLPMDIAENLRQQMLKHFNKSGFTENFRKWYTKVQQDSSRLTKLWSKNVPKSQRLKDGKRFSDEWVFGDNEGNPNKRFLGVWSKKSQNTWKGTVGRNIAIAPFIISRRKGVAAFRKGGDFDQK